MPIRIMTIPFDPDKELFDEEELNQFLLNKRIKKMRAEFFYMDSHPYWTVFIEYETRLSDYKRKEEEGLNDAQKLVFRRLREWRKETAEKEGVPVFLIANNSHLADLARFAPASLESLRQIRGFGKKKIDKYGKDIIKIVQGIYEKKPDRDKKSPDIPVTAEKSKKEPQNKEEKTSDPSDAPPWDPIFDEIETK